MDPLSPDDDALVANDVLMALLDDRASGRTPVLEDYLRRFPGHEAVVRREWQAIMEAPQETDADGERIGSYELLEEIGRGGQARVFKARDARLDRIVALKVLTPRGGNALASGLRRFRQEAAILARLDHPGIGAIYDVGEDDGRLYLAMAFVDGPTLATRLTATEGRATPTEVLGWLRDVARALAAAHRSGIVHRDVKPSNILIGRDGRAVLVDFGIAGIVDDAAGPTRTGDLLGTPAYMAPEQILGGTVDHRADIHALGVTLVEAMTGRRPFDGATRESLFHAVTTQERPPLRDLATIGGRDLAAVAETAIAPDPAQRYESADALARDLEAVLEGRPAGVRRAGFIERRLRTLRRHPRETALVLVIVVLLFSAALLGGAAAALRPVWQLGQETRRAAEREDAITEAWMTLLAGDETVARQQFAALARAGSASEIVLGERLSDLVIARKTASAPPLGMNETIDDITRAVAAEVSGVDDSGTIADPSFPGLVRGAAWLLLGGDDAVERAASALREALLATRTARLFEDVLFATAVARGGDAEHAVIAVRLLEERWPDAPAARAARLLVLARHDLERAAGEASSIPSVGVARRFLGAGIASLPEAPRERLRAAGPEWSSLLEDARAGAGR